MFHEKIKSPFSSAVHSVSSIISEFTDNPGSDLTRHRKLPAEKLITFLVSQGASGTKNELLDFFDMDPQAPTASALNQQRAKLRPDALELVFRHFNSLAASLDGAAPDIVLLLLTVPALPSPADLPLLPPNILCLGDILPGAFTVCI